MITFSTITPIQLFYPNPNNEEEIKIPSPNENRYDEAPETDSLISSKEYNNMIDKEDIKDYLMTLGKLFNNELSFNYYSNTGYYICKHSSEMNDYSFTYWELFTVNHFIKQLECIFKSFFNLKVCDIDFYKVYTENIKDNNYSNLIGSSKIDDIKKLSAIFYIDLIKIKDFLENKKNQYEPTGECVWGDNKIALKKLYELTRNKYIEDKGFEYFYSAFLNNHYVGSKRNSFNLLNNHRIVWSYFLNEIQRFFVPYYNINYTEWVTNTVRFKGKSTNKKRVSEILNLYSEEGTNKEKLKKQIKEIEEIIKKVDKYYLNENYPENYNNVHNTSL